MLRYYSNCNSAPYLDENIICNSICFLLFFFFFFLLEEKLLRISFHPLLFFEHLKHISPVPRRNFYDFTSTLSLTADTLKIFDKIDNLRISFRHCTRTCNYYYVIFSTSIHLTIRSDIMHTSIVHLLD